tara:strand:+ start:95 stop:205 length:111 start_codon:yes stop_codon:yes gene_type:complete
MMTVGVAIVRGRDMTRKDGDTEVKDSFYGNEREEGV